jgi:hypothetical protein
VHGDATIVEDEDVQRRQVPLSSSCLKFGALRQNAVVMDREAKLTQAGIGEAGAF